MINVTQQRRRRPVIRVFVSSTFSDLKKERNALQEHVFPKLEQLCGRNGFQFQAIDLRWGVSSEAGLDHRTMRICFDELRRAQEISPEPNFLVLLGNRYGWRPLPEEISKVEFEKLEVAAKSGGENETPIPGTHGKTALQVLGEWFRCDENAVVSNPSDTSPNGALLNYILQPRTQNLGDERVYTRTMDGLDTPDWSDVQQVLWCLINTAFPATLLDQRFNFMDWSQHVADVCDRQHLKRAIPQIARFQAPATEQEIWCGALSAPNAERHVVACFRELENRDSFAPGEVNEFFDQTNGKVDAVAAKRQSDLKNAIKQRLGENAPVPIPFSRLKRENRRVVVDTLEEDIRDFCDKVRDRLWRIIERQIAEYWEKSTPASAERAARELKIEHDEHKRFGRERGGADAFVGRKTELQAIREYLQSDLSWPLVVHGPSGCGKTALMWRAFEEIPETRQPIIRLIGITPLSSHVRSLLRSLCQKLRERHPREGELPTDIKMLGEELQEHFRSARPEQPLILFLDGLDQLSDADGGRLLNWIPAGQLPAHVKLVVSCLSDRGEGDPAGQPFAELTRRRLPVKNSINLESLSANEAMTLLFDRWLPQAGRKVSVQQMELIGQHLKSEDCRLPIYLKLLFEEARLWHSYDPAPELGKSVSAILDQLIKRLSQPANHGRLLVERVLGYLGASRHGLAESEILELLFADPDYKAALDRATEKTRHELPTSATRIPIAIWSRLRFDLAPYLTERAAPGANVLSFYHRQVTEWVQEHFANASYHIWQPHQSLAKYFHGVADPTGDRSWHGNCLRGLSELPYHQCKGELWMPLEQTLCDLNFVEAKCVSLSIFNLLEDFDHALEIHNLPACAQLRRVLGMTTPIISTRPMLVLQTICNRLIWCELLQEPLATSLTAALQKLDCSSYWIRANGPLPDSEGTTELGVPFSHQSFFQALSLDKRVIVVVSQNGEAEIRSLPNGELRRTRQLPFEHIIAVALNEDGTSLAYMQVGGQIRTEESAFELAGRERERGVIAYHSLRGVFAVTNDNRLVAWDPVSNRSRMLSENLPKPTRVVKIAQDGKRAFFLAGDINQKIGISTWSDGNWVTKPVPYAGMPITDADIDWEHGFVLLACRDRRLRLFVLNTETVMSELAYETVTDVSVKGAPVKCALGSFDSEGFAFLATTNGQIACWNWRTKALVRLDDYCAITEGVNLILFDVLPAHGQLFFSTHLGGKVNSRKPRRFQLHRHQVTVTDCILTDVGKIVSFSEQEQTIRWFDAKGLRQVGLRVITAPSAIARTRGTDDVLVGTGEGLVMRMTPDREIKPGEVFPSLHEGVVALFETDNGETIAAGKSGMIVRYRLPLLSQDVIRYATGQRMQQKVLPAGADSLFLSIHEDSEPGGLTWAITLAEPSGREERMFSTQERFAAVAVNTNGSAVCVAGKTVRILRRSRYGWAVTNSRNAPVAHATFLYDGALIAVARADVSWIEIWKTDETMETIATIEVPAEVSCLTAKDDRIVAGLRSGFVISLQLHTGPFR